MIKRITKVLLLGPAILVDVTIVLPFEIVKWICVGGMFGNPKLSEMLLDW